MKYHETNIFIFSHKICLHLPYKLFDQRKTTPKIARGKSTFFKYRKVTQKFM